MKIQSLNVLKFVMAIFVIVAHTLCLTGMHNVISDSRIITFVIRVAVPVFFIISGYLLFRKMTIKKFVYASVIFSLAFAGILDQAPTMDFFMFLTPLIVIASFEDEESDKPKLLY